MSKAAPIKVTPTNTNKAQFNQPTYLQGEKVYFVLNGVNLPCIITSIVQHSQATTDNTGLTYNVIGDLNDSEFPFPGNAGKGPYKNVALTSLLDRTDILPTLLIRALDSAKTTEAYAV
jgi:hypothetical protein